MLRRLIALLVDFCRHECRHDWSWPQRNQQTCVRCGEQRPYFLLAHDWPRDPNRSRTRQAV